MKHNLNICLCCLSHCSHVLLARNTTFVCPNKTVKHKIFVLSYISRLAFVSLTLKMKEDINSFRFYILSVYILELICFLFYPINLSTYINIKYTVLSFSVYSAFKVCFFNSSAINEKIPISGYYKHITNYLPISQTDVNVCMIPSLRGSPLISVI